MWPSASLGFARAVHARRRLVACGVACFALALPPAASAQGGTVFGPSDQSPPKGSNPCPPKMVPNDVYDSFKDLLAEVLGAKAGVVSAIDAQVRSKVPDADEAPVSVEISVVTKAQFVKEFVDDVDSLNPGKTPEQLKAEAAAIFDRAAAYTYTTDKTNAAGTQKIKIKIFCKESFRTSIIDKTPIRELVVHELVHAKLYSMLVLGVAEGSLPFRDHDEDPDNDTKTGTQGDKEFYDEVKKLFDLLKKNLGLTYTPGSRFTAPMVATLVGSDGTRTELTGTGTVTIGDAGDSDGDGRLEVPTEMVGLSLTGGGFSVRLNPFHPSDGFTEEESPGEPFPADSSFELVYIVSTGSGGGQRRRTVLEASPTEWPPFGETYTSPDPAGPLSLESLTFQSIDHDGDGDPDQSDPDDDNDGVPDAEDPVPLG